MFRRGWIKDHHGSGGTLTWSRGSEQCGSIGYTYMLLDDHDPTLTLNFTRTPNGREPETIKQVIQLAATKPEYGGRRWWMICPANGMRVATLHLPPGGDRFASRKAWRLGYHSQRIAGRDRPFEALFKLQKKLGCSEVAPVVCTGSRLG
ncbi:hypothetical protein EAH84_15400 [Sphingomonas oligophenolica]|uniref:Uncharacterized protein n=2 Tax=Sphingomonas oligophenolica TaxID=301154 RepID=A0A502BVG3_9SPHN|nr:hypothetical protein EAH84_15400 [Sphingomonas oligophenolica]